MTFRSPQLLWLLAAIPLLLTFFVIGERQRLSTARRFVNERLRGGAAPVRLLRPWLLALALLLAALALAGPFKGYELVPIVARESNRVLIIDVSNSMAAEDVGTSRLTAAKGLAMRLAEAQQGRVALVVFEATPDVVAPLTSDGEAVASLIDTLVPGEVGTPGSDLGSAILAAMKLVERDPSQKADLVVLSDGEDQGARLAEAAARAKARGIAISTIVIGSSSGATIPTPDGPLRSSNGEVVTTYARSDAMQSVAAETGGTMLTNPFGARSLDPLLARGAAATERETHARVPIDRYQWPLAGAFLLLMLASLAHRGAE